MKKFFDKYLFSKFGLQLLASIIIVLGGSILIAWERHWAMDVDSNLFQQWLWGFRQISSPVSAIGTLEMLSTMKLSLPLFILLVMSILSWFMSIAVFSFITGAIVNAFRNRQQMINEGNVRYFFKEHGIIIGWNFQGIAIARQLLSKGGIKELLIVSGQRAQDIKAELKLELKPKELDKVFIYRGDIHTESILKSLCTENAKTVIVLGDKNGTDNNGGNIRIVAMLAEHIKGIEKEKKNERKIKLYLNIDDATFYVQSRTMEMPSEADSIFDIEIYNYYESWAWQCWSARKGEDADGDYLPIRYRRDAERAEIFVIGATPMGQAFVNYAMPLMTYGVEGKRNRITLFDVKSDGALFLPKREILDALPEVEVKFIQRNGCSEEANDIMLEAALREDTAVTIVIAIANPDEAAKGYLQLSHSLRRQNISILLWQATVKANCIDKKYLQAAGDNATLRYFGMTECIPWLNNERQEMGKAVNFYYSIKDKLPPGEDPRIVAVSPSAWNEHEANNQWQNMKRWKKWSSINSGDSFKEKSYAFPNCDSNPAHCRAFLHTEHNRWWTERLLSGWIPGERNDAKFIHNDMVPFDKLDAATIDIDKINIAAMAKHGFLLSNN